MANYGDPVVILGRREFAEAMNKLPGRVVQKIMDDWTMRQAKQMSALARKSAPRDRSLKRNKPETARLWRIIRASKVRSPERKFKMISRAIAYGAKSRSVYARNRNRRKNAKARMFGPPAPRGRHFHLAVLGTKPRKNKNGRYTGSMWGKTPNPLFWQKAQIRSMAIANGDVGRQLRDAYQRGLDLEMKRLSRKYK